MNTKGTLKHWKLEAFVESYRELPKGISPVGKASSAFVESYRELPKGILPVGRASSAFSCRAMKV